MDRTTIVGLDVEKASDAIIGPATVDPARDNTCSG